MQCHRRSFPHFECCSVCSISARQRASLKLQILVYSCKRALVAFGNSFVYLNVKKLIFRAPFQLQILVCSYKRALCLDNFAFQRKHQEAVLLQQSQPCRDNKIHCVATTKSTVQRQICILHLAFAAADLLQVLQTVQKRSVVSACCRFCRLQKRAVASVCCRFCRLCKNNL